MMRFPVLLLMSGIAMLGATSCSAEPSLENWQKTQHFERAVSDAPLSRILEQLSQQIIGDMFMGPDGPADAVAYAGFTVEDSDALVRKGYAPYTLDISEYAHRQIAQALSQDDIDTLFAAGTDPASIEAVMCAYRKATASGKTEWDTCHAEGFVELPEGFRQAHERYAAAYQAVVDGPQTQTYFGGVSCRVLDQVQARLTNDKHMIDFSGTTLGMSGQEKEPCNVLKARLDALDTAKGTE